MGEIWVMSLFCHLEFCGDFSVFGKPQLLWLWECMKFIKIICISISKIQSEWNVWFIIIRFVIPVVFYNNYIRVCILSDTTTGGREYVYYIGVLLHVSAFFFGHLQVGLKNYWINFCKQLYLIYMGVCEVFRVRDLACCVGVVVLHLQITIYLELYSVRTQPSSSVVFSVFQQCWNLNMDQLLFICVVLWADFKCSRVTWHFEITWGSHGNVYVDYCVLRYNMLLCGWGTCSHHLCCWMVDP